MVTEQDLDFTARLTLDDDGRGEAALALVKARQRFADKDGEDWLRLRTRICKCAISKHLRKVRNRREVTNTAFDYIGTHTPDFSLRFKLLEALLHLPADLRAIVEKRFGLGVQAEEIEAICAETGLKRWEYCQRLAEALERLRLALLED